MKVLAALALCCLAATAPASWAANMSHEEMVVRSTYAKLAYGVQLGAVHQAVSRNRQLGPAELSRALEDGNLRFELSDLSSGAIADIANRGYGDLVSIPNVGDEVLNAGICGFVFTDNTNKETADNNACASWQTEQRIHQWNLQTPMREVLALMDGGSRYTRYAAFAVHMGFQGRKRVYKAMFLFGKDDKGDEEVMAGDMVAGNSGGALGYFVKHTIYPSVLLETRFATNPAIADWLRANQAADASCRPGKRETCCDLATLRCHISAGDISTAPKP